MSDTTVAAIRDLTLAFLVVTTLYKLLVMYRNTARWNGLGQALRAEKWLQFAFWLWLLLRPYWEALQGRWWIVGLALAFIVVELRVTWLLPRVPLRQGGPRDRHA